MCCQSWFFPECAANHVFSKNVLLIMFFTQIVLPIMFFPQNVLPIMFFFLQMCYQSCFSLRIYCQFVFFFTECPANHVFPT
jgi:hypothetical protein